MAIGVSNSVTLEPCNQQASLRRLQTRNDRNGLKGKNLRKFKETSLGLKVWMFVNVWDLGIFPMWSSIFVFLFGESGVTKNVFQSWRNFRTIRIAQQGLPNKNLYPLEHRQVVVPQHEAKFHRFSVKFTFLLPKTELYEDVPQLPQEKKQSYNCIASFSLPFTKKCWVSKKRGLTPQLVGGLRVDIIRKALTVKTPSACVLAQPKTTQQVGGGQNFGIKSGKFFWKTKNRVAFESSVHFFAFPTHQSNGTGLFHSNLNTKNMRTLWYSIFIHPRWS